MHAAPSLTRAQSVIDDILPDHDRCDDLTPHWKEPRHVRVDRAVVCGIERTYHRRRRQARLGRLTPIEYENIMNPAVDPAA